MEMMWKMLRDTWRLSAPGENLVACLFVIVPLVAILYCLITKKSNAHKQVALICGIGIILMMPVLIFDIQLPYHRNHSTGYFEIVTPSQGSALILIISFAVSILLSFLVSKITETLKKRKLRKRKHR